MKNNFETLRSNNLLIYSDGSVKVNINGKTYETNSNKQILIPESDYSLIHTNLLPEGYHCLISEFNAQVSRIDDSRANLFFSISLPHELKHYPEEFLDTYFKLHVETVVSKSNLTLVDASRSEFVLAFESKIPSSTLAKCAEMAETIMLEVLASVEGKEKKENLNTNAICKSAEKLAKAEQKTKTFILKFDKKEYQVSDGSILLDRDEAQEFPYEKYEGKFPLFISQFRNGEMIGEPLFQVDKISDSKAIVTVVLESDNIKALKSSSSFGNLYLKSLLQFIHSIPQSKLDMFDNEPGRERIQFSIAIEGTSLRMIIEKAFSILD